MVSFRSKNWLVSSLFVLLLHVTAATTSAGAQLEAEVPVEVFRQAPASLDENIPTKFTLSGQVVDLEGTPVAKAKIAINGKYAKTTKSDGSFSLSKKLRPDDQISVTHADHIKISKRAGDIFVGVGLSVRIETVRYTESFNISPDGGSYTSGGITLIVPKGAVSKSVEVRAAILPMDFAYEDTGDMQMQRMATIEFAPAGLKFNAPISVTMPAAYSTGAATGEVLLFDPKTGHYNKDPDAALQVSGDQVTMFLSHFSRRSAGDPAQGIVSGKIKSLSSDINGDGKLTSEDAEFIINLVGGTHTAEVTSTTVGESAVMKASETGSSSDTSSSTTVSGGISVAGVGIDASATVSRSTARDIVNRTGLESRQTQENTRGLKVQAAEYETQCKYLYGIYDFYEVEIWERHAFSEAEMTYIRDAHDNRGGSGDSWGYYNWNKSTTIALNRTIYGKIKVAVRVRNGVYEAYVRTALYVVRKYRGSMVKNCITPAWQSKVTTVVGDRTGDDAMRAMEQNYSIMFGGNAETGYGGWGILPNSEPEFHRNRECGANATGSITVRSSDSITTEAQTSQNQSGGSDTSVSGSATIPLPGGISVGVGAGQSDSSGWSRTSAETHGQAFVSTTSTTISWEIVDAHPTHWSDHMVAKLHNVVVRGDPPKIITRPIGLAIIRYAERPCVDDGGDVTGGGSDDPSGSSGEDRSGGDGTGTREPDRRPPVITPGPGEYHPPNEQRQSATDNQNEKISYSQKSYVAVSFTALDGKTLIDPDRLGPLQTLTITAIDGSNVPATEENVTVSEKDGSVEIDVKTPIAIASVVATGSHGIVELLANPSSGGVQGGAIWPSDGAIDLSNGALQETFKVPEITIDLAEAPASHQVFVSGQQADVIAMRSSEVAVTAQNVPLPVSGTAGVIATSPNGQSVSEEVPAWGYVVAPQPVTAVGVWAPINFQCSGLSPSSELLVNFFPSEGQTIEPQSVTLTCGAASTMIPIAQYQTTVLGPQQFNLTVERK